MKKISPNILKKAVNISLDADGTISGAVSGSWELVDDYYADITIDGKTYKGVFLRQWTELTEAEDITFTALSDEGKTIWGIKRHEDKSQQTDELDETGELEDKGEPEDGKKAGAVISWLDTKIFIIIMSGLLAFASGLVFLKKRIFSKNND